VHQYRDAEPAAFHHGTLNVVHERGALRRPQTGGAAYPGHLADPVRDNRAHHLGADVIAGHQVGQPDPAQLGEFLVKIHQGEQRTGSCLGRLAGIAERGIAERFRRHELPLAVDHRRLRGHCPAAGLSPAADDDEIRFIDLAQRRT
jgi:hypothetical protein